MKDLVIIGAGGYGREIVDLVHQINKVEKTWNLLGLIDDKVTKTPEGYPVLGDLKYLLERKDRPYFIISIANPEVRERIARCCLVAGFPAATLIHPSVIQNPGSSVGEGTILYIQCLLGSNAKIGSFCILDGYCRIGHDTEIGDFCSLMPETLIGGESHLGAKCYCGQRTTMLNRISVTPHCTFGSCSCIVKDATVPGTYVGVPAKLIKPLNK